MDLLDKILKLFSESGLTDSVLEKEIGLPKSIIYKWRSGINKSYKKYASEISNYFNVSTDYLLGKTDNPAPADQPENDEVAEYLDILHKRGDMRMLFSVAKNATKEDIERAATIIEALIKKERNED